MRVISLAECKKINGGQTEVIQVIGSRIKQDSPIYQVETNFPSFYEVNFSPDRTYPEIDELCGIDQLEFDGMGSEFNSFSLPAGMATALSNFLEAVDEYGSDYSVTVEGPGFSDTLTLKEVFSNQGFVGVSDADIMKDGQPARGSHSFNNIEINFDLIVSQEGSHPDDYLPAVYETFLHEGLHQYNQSAGGNWPIGTHDDVNMNFPSVINQFISDLKDLGIDLTVNDDSDDSPC